MLAAAVAPHTICGHVHLFQESRPDIWQTIALPDSPWKASKEKKHSEKGIKKDRKQERKKAKKKENNE